MTNVDPVLDSLQSDATLENKSADGVVTISGSFSDLGIPDTHSLTILWGDGTQTVVAANDSAIDQSADTFTVTHVYPTGGIFDIEVTAQDDDGGVSGALTTSAVVTGIGVNNGVLQIIGSDANEKIDIRPKYGDKYRVRVKVKHQSTVTELVEQSDVTSIHVVGCGGRDHITVASSISLPTLLEGGAGDDQIFGGSGNDVIDGGDGRDKLLGRNGVDRIFGGDGSDWIWGNHDGDSLFGGAGDDKIWGKLGNDHIYGEDGDDILYGNQGDDYINGGNGNDLLWGGTGDDTLIGGAGNDILFGNFGDDVLNGEEGDDILFGGFGSDTLSGGDGCDWLFDGWWWIWE